MPPFSLSSTLFGEVGGFEVAATFSLFRSCRSAGKVVAVVAGVRESGGLFSRKPAGGLGLHGTFLTGWVESGDVLIEDGGEEVKFVAFSVFRGGVLGSMVVHGRESGKFFSWEPAGGLRVDGTFSAGWSESDEVGVEVAGVKVNFFNQNSNGSNFSVFRGGWLGSNDLGITAGVRGSGRSVSWEPAG